MFEPNYNSYYKEYANKSLDWLPMDTKELYEKNLKEKYQLLKQHDWIDKSFTYKFNSHGFRCEEFTNKPTIMVLGCSFTCGIGLPIEFIWPELISKNLNMHCANLGIGGGSNDTAFRLCNGWIDVIRPQVVILLRTNPDRLELLNSTTIENLSLLWEELITGYSSFLKKWTIDYNNIYFNDLKNQIAIQNICVTRNIKFLSLRFNQIPRADLARDLCHRGIKSNKLFAEYVLTKI